MKRRMNKFYICSICGYKSLDIKQYFKTRNKNKDKIIDQKTQKIKCTICKTVFGLESWKRHTRSTSHKNMLTEFPNIKEEYEHEIQASKENEDEIQDDKE